MVIEEMIRVLASQGKFKTNPMMFEIALYYHGAILAGMINACNSEGKLINFFGLLLSGSGSGKDFSFETVSKVFNINAQQYRKYLADALDKNMAASGPHESYTFEERQSAIINMPKSITLGLEGTKEGLFSVCKSQGISGFGSLNLTHSEFGDIITKSAELLSGLKELYDGRMVAKIIKSANESSISSVTANLMAFGSHEGIASEARNELSKLVKSGMFRRTFIIDIEPTLTETQKCAETTGPITAQIMDIQRTLLAFYDAECKSQKTNDFRTTIDLNEEAIGELDKVKQMLIDESNADVSDGMKRSEIGAITMIENLAHIISILEEKGGTDAESVLKAFSFYSRCRASTEGTFKITHPYKTMFKMLSKKSGMTITEMAANDDTVPTAKNRIQDELALLREHCYLNNMILIEAGSQVVRYSIEELPRNDNTKIIISVCQDNKWEKSVNFKPFEVPFFGTDGSTIESLVQSGSIQSFCTATFEPSPKAIDGHRQLNGFISGQNMIAFDIDEGMTLDTATKLLLPYTYLIYTTKSHGKDKNGLVCDRFRIMLPTKQEFHVDAEQHKQLYNNIADFLGLQIYDTQTRNVSRLWYTNKNAVVIANKAENLDVAAFIPETETNKVFKTQIADLDTYRLDASVVGIYKWFFANTSKGNRNDHLFRVGKFIKDLGQEFESHVEVLNSKLQDSLSAGDLKTIIGSVAKK